jgi:hypothetical protein
MVNSDELIGTTEHLTLETRCRINRCRYNRFRLYISLYVPGNTKFLPVHIPYIANDYSLFMPFIIIWNVLVLSMLFMAFQSHIHSHSCCPPNLSSVFLAWFSHSDLILYARVAKFLCSVAFFGSDCLPECYFLVAIWPVAVQELSLHLFVPGYFNNRWDSPVLLTTALNPGEILQEIRIMDRLCSSCVK